MSRKERSPSVAGLVDAVARAGREKQELSEMSLLVWEQSSDCVIFKIFFKRDC